MSTWNRIACLYIDVDALGTPPLLDGKTSSPLAQAPMFIQSDKFPLQLYFRKKSANTGGASAAVEQDLTDNIVFAAKETSKINGSTVLFSAVGFVKMGTDDDVCYQALLNLETPELTAAMTTYTIPLLITVDIEVQNADNTERSTFQFTTTVKKQAYAGESHPVPGAPLYPAPNQIMLKHADGSSIAFSEGKHPYLYCVETGLFHPLTTKVVDGHVVLATSDEGVLNP